MGGDTETEVRLMRVQAIKYMLMVEDMDRAVAFYRDVVGLELKYESSHWSELALGGAVVALHGGGGGEFTETGLNLQVDDIEDACRELVAGGGALVHGPQDPPNEPIRLAMLVDTEGNQIRLVEQKS